MPKPFLQRLCSVLLLATLAACATAQPQPVDRTDPIPQITGIYGAVNGQSGEPAAGAFVYAYRHARQGLRGPADFAAEVDADGNYLLDLVEGSYHLVARQRQTGSDAGPPRPGDAWAVHSRNPVIIAPGEAVRVDFMLLGNVTPRQMRQGSLSSGDTGFTGRLLDPQDRPQAGAIAMAYRDTDFQRMPDYTSGPADSNGRFTLYVPEAGRFCLSARMKTRGQPLAGEPYGTLGRGDDSCRSVDAGTILDVGEIVLRPYSR